MGSGGLIAAQRISNHWQTATAVDRGAGLRKLYFSPETTKRSSETTRSTL